MTAYAGWLPASSAVYRIAFGAKGSFEPERHEWGVPPDPWAVAALASRAEGVIWRPAVLPPSPAYGYRKAAKQLMRKHEAACPGSGSAEKLLHDAHQVAARHQAWLAALVDAENRLTEAVGTGALKATGIRVNDPYATPGLGLHVEVPPLVIAAPGRVIRTNGMVCWRGREFHDFGSPDAGPYFAGLRVDAAEVRALWPSQPLPKGDYASMWDVVLLRALGTAGPHGIGERPNDLNKGHDASEETWIAHALRVGAWAAIYAAERKLADLLLSGEVTAFGWRSSADRVCRLPAELFHRRELRLNSSGILDVRLPPATLHTNPSAPGPSSSLQNERYLDARISLTGLENAWRALDAGQAVLPLAAKEGVPAVADNARRFWTATQVLTLLAFGEPQTRQEREASYEEFLRRWRSDPPDDVLELLTSRASPCPSYPWRPQQGVLRAFQTPFASPRGPALARAIRADHRRDLKRQVGFGELANMLRAELIERDRQRTMLADANRVLWAAIWDETLTAWGVPCATPRALHERLPRALGLSDLRFRRDTTEPNDTVTAEAWAETSRAPSFRDVRFDRVAVETAGLCLAQDASVTSKPAYRTGLAGRPTAWHLVEREFERRSASGNTEATLAAESIALSCWLQTTHPEAARMKANTLENRLRPIYRCRAQPTK